MFGLTVRASVDNLLDTNESFSRTFFDGRRNATNSNVLFTEDRDRFYGPVFTLSHQRDDLARRLGSRPRPPISVG